MNPLLILLEQTFSCIVFVNTLTVKNMNDLEGSSWRKAWMNFGLDADVGQAVLTGVGRLNEGIKYNAFGSQFYYHLLRLSCIELVIAETLNQCFVLVDLDFFMEH